MIRTVHRRREGSRPPGRATAALLLVVISLAAAPAARGQPAGAFSTTCDAALANDAEYRASRFELQGREQAVPIARAGLLPTVTATYSESRVRGEREQLTALGQPLVYPVPGAVYVRRDLALAIVGDAAGPLD